MARNRQLYVAPREWEVDTDMVEAMAKKFQSTRMLDLKRAFEDAWAEAEEELRGKKKRWEKVYGKPWTAEEADNGQYFVS